MALVVADRVLETTTTTGTGTVTLAGAVTGYQSFSAVGNGNTTYYTIADQAGANWEVGIGTYTSSGTTLSRDTVLASSNSGSLVNFTSGTKNVFVTYPAGKSFGLGQTLGISNGGTGQTTANAALNALLPSQSTNSGKYLTTNGTNASWATAGLTQFVEAENTSSPNATVPVDSLTATDAGYTDIDVAFVPKGAGAVLGQVSDGTTTGGDKRGTYATDWQRVRTVSTQVASGQWSTLSGGEENTASGEDAVVAGGYKNVASGQGSAIGGGWQNEASGTLSFAAGNLNFASGNYSVVFGDSNTASGAYSVAIGSTNSATQGSAIALGSNNTVTGANAYAIGDTNTVSALSAGAFGRNHTADASYATVVGGYTGKTRGVQGYTIFPASVSPTAGVTQAGVLVLGVQTTTATATVLRSNTSAASATNQVVLANNSALAFRAMVVANVTGGGNTKAWRIEGVIKRGANAAATSIVGAAIVDILAADSGASTWTVAATADTTNGTLQITVTGQASTTIRWVARVDTAEIAF